MAFKKYTCDHNFFETIDTEEKAYWLGFIAADGNVSKKYNHIKLGLKSDDINHINKYKTSLKSNHPIKNYSRVNPSGTTSNISNITIYSPKLKIDLINKGVTPNKSFTILKLNNIPIHLEKHIFRGILDGDGSISFHKRGNSERVNLRFYGSKSILEWILVYCNKLVNTKSNIYKHKSIYRLAFSDKIARTIIQNLYQDSIIYLDRKYDLFKRSETISFNILNKRKDLYRV